MLPLSDVYIILVKRGNLEMAFSLTWLGLNDSTPRQLAWDAVKAIFQLQGNNIGRMDKPLDPNSHEELHLFLANRDSPLLPLVPLRPQLEGQWKTNKALPEEARVDIAGIPNSRDAPWLYLELREATGGVIIL